MSRLRPLHVALLIPWMVAIIGARLPLRDNSYLWHVRAGTIQIDAGSVITNDPFSFTFAGVSWRTQSWLLELAYGWLDRSFGLVHYQWIVGLSALVTFAAIGLLVWRSVRSILGVAISMAFTAWIAAPFLNPRPVVVSYALLAVTYLVARTQKLRWTLLPIAWIWASVHASYLIGIALVGVIRLSEREFRKGFADGAVMLGVSFVTAHGWGAVDFLSGFVSNREALSLLTEWATPNFLSLSFLPVVGLLIAMLAAGVRGHLQPKDLLLAAFGLVVMISASRSVFIGWMILLPLAAKAAAPADDLNLFGRRSGLGIPAVVAAMVVLLLPLLLPVDSGFQEGRFPTELYSQLDPDLRTFHDDGVGGFLIYAIGPDTKVFVDDRAEVYGADFFEGIIETRSGTPRWQELFERYQVTQAIISIDDTLFGVLKDNGWREVSRDEFFVVLQAERT